jgi:hypothetical protein
MREHFSTGNGRGSNVTWFQAPVARNNERVICSRSARLRTRSQMAHSYFPSEVNTYEPGQIL